jgi:hypothetical protein
LATSRQTHSKPPWIFRARINVNPLEDFNEVSDHIFQTLIDRSVAEKRSNERMQGLTIDDLAQGRELLCVVAVTKTEGRHASQPGDNG